MAELATGKAWDDVFIAEMVTPFGLSATDYAMYSTASGYVRNTNPRIAGGVRAALPLAASLVASGAALAGWALL